MDKKHRKIISDTSWSYSGSESSMRKLGNSRIRQHSKAVAVSALEDYTETKSPDFILKLKWSLEDRYSHECYYDQYYGPAVWIETILKKLGVGNFSLYKCTCPNLDKLTDKEILELDGLQ